MTYEDLVTYCGVISLILFIALFAVVLIYAFWPGNRERFEQARLIPLDKDAHDFPGDHNGR
jgi:cytochrome c oxidase cbb3-type subunit 4